MTLEEKPRASPDALLAMAEREGRGKLRVFLGAAPGVGKTYAMLQAARAAKASGVDVVVGIVETHGRQETEAAMADLEVLPRRSIPYRGHLVPEFDLEGALARRPRLLLVDEYAHSNVPGSRHPKRWQDVTDILDAGIDVWTTLNIQHLESLNEVVQRITGVRVRETVPDTALQDADEVLLVDLPPDELLKRLGEGKVYVQDTAARAIERFFKPSNLTALRELALRRVAARGGQRPRGAHAGRGHRGALGGRRAHPRLRRTRHLRRARGAGSEAPCGPCRRALVRRHRGAPRHRDGCRRPATGGRGAAPRGKPRGRDTLPGGQRPC